MRQTDGEILEQDELIANEIENGKIPDPNAPQEMPGEEGGEMGDLGSPVNEIEIDGSATEAPEIETPGKGVI